MEARRPRIVIIGTGNVASHLAPALQRVGDVVQVVSRNVDHARDLAQRIGVDNYTSRLADITPDAHYYIIAVNDDAIAEIADATPDVGVWAHTSGSTPLQALAEHKSKCGVLYPLHSFTRGVDVDWSQVPLFVEGSDPEVTQQFEELASQISQKVKRADSADRRQLHIAAVIACNFANHLWDISDTLLRPLGVDFADIKPLVQNMLDKAAAVGPHAAQTGPARRGDTAVINSHIESLPTDEAEIYRLLSNNIIKTYEQDKL